MAQGGAKNFVDLAVLRVISGAFEATADPAFVLVRREALFLTSFLLAYQKLKNALLRRSPALGSLENSNRRSSAT